ncbi:Picot [Cordylochernes scorpioides]|uniref:Picot n=1 Tax=Cordylochernes scorpioides TaxID=51811 RepID=A0ABY6L2V3_9ARAC|nr:Picot [Cordylochernes scorpioides]
MALRKDHPRISLSELDFIKNNTEPPTEKAPKAPWMKLLKSGPLWGLIIAHLGQNCGFYMLLTELPTYMGTILHYDIKQNGLLSSLPYLLQAIVGLVVGRGMDWALKREYISVTKVRKICNSIGFLGPAICLIAVCQAGCLAKLSTAFFCLALAFNGFIYSGYQVVHIDMDPSLAGTLFGITNGVATLGGILSPIYVGFLTENNQTLARWNIIFYTVAGIYVVSNTIFLYIGSAKRQQWESQQDETPPLVGDKSSRDSYNSMGQAPPMEGYNKY